MPTRIQLSRRKGWRKPDGAVVVARPTKWGNPCRVGMFRDYTAADAVSDYRKYIERDPNVRTFEITFGVPPTLNDIRRELRGRDLACWCPLGQPCHADVLLDIANKQAGPDEVEEQVRSERSERANTLPFPPGPHR